MVTKGTDKQRAHILDAVILELSFNELCLACQRAGLPEPHTQEHTTRLKTLQQHLADPDTLESLIGHAVVDSVLHTVHTMSAGAVAGIHTNL